MSSLGGYQIGYTALSALYITPLAVLWFVSFCLARTKQDPARVGISWLKAVFPVWIFGLLLVLASGSVQLWMRYDENGYYSDWSAVVRAVDHVSATGNFLLQLASIFLFITFVELAGGYMFCLKNPNETSRTHKFGRISILVWSVVLFAMVLSVFALRHSYVVKYADVYDRYDTEASFKARLTNTRMELAVRILLWLTSIPMVGLASFTVHKTKNHQLLRSGSIIFLVATILDLIRHLINMAIFAEGYVDLAVTFIVEPFFNFTLMFVVLVMLFALAIRKATGLWSKPQPDWAYPTVTFVHTMPYPPGQVPVGMVPGQPQYMPQQQPMQGVPAYLQVAQQQQGQQQGYYYYPQPTQQQPQQMQQQPQQMQQQQQQQQPQQPQPVYQQQTQEQPKTTENV
jgi:ABC-type multidrug transport system fused ATPase/permease subunit